MTQEEKLEEAKRLYKTANADQRYVLESLFPELAESEDERMRKTIINTIEDCSPILSPEVQKRMIAWLEKQGESDETKAKMFLINKGYPIDANGVFPTYEEMYNIIRDGLEHQVEQKSIFDFNANNWYVSKVDGKIHNIYNSGVEPKFHKDKKIEEEYNGEDYGIDSLFHAQRILEKTLGKVEGYQTDDGILSHKCAISTVKKLYEKKSTEWSEEDELRVKDIIYFLDTAKKHYASTVELDACINWLKTIKQRMEDEQ